MTQLTAEQLAAGWLPHDGGPCPVPLDSRPRVVWGDGKTISNRLPAGARNWAYIVGYLPDPEFEATDEGPCTDCWDTGVTVQTERRCACQPDPIAALLAPDEALVEAVAERMARQKNWLWESLGDERDTYDDEDECRGYWRERSRAALIAAGQELAKRKDGR